MIFCTGLVRPLLIALTLLTVLPVKYPLSATDIDRRRSLYLYPAVGLVIGMLLWLVAWWLPAGSMLPAALVLTVWVGLTGGLHLDGLADAMDAWVGGHGDTRKTLQILRDPAAGPMAVIALVLVLGLKFAALSVLFEQGMMVALLTAPLMGRGAVVLLYASTPYVRRGGLGESLRTVYVDRYWMMLSLAGSTLLAVLLLDVLVVPVLLVALAVFWLVRRSTIGRLHGFTGDIAGALVELVEASALVTLALAVAG